MMLCIAVAVKYNKDVGINASLVVRYPCVLKLPRAMHTLDLKQSTLVDILRRAELC